MFFKSIKMFLEEIPAICYDMFMHYYGLFIGINHPYFHGIHTSAPPSSPATLK